MKKTFLKSVATGIVGLTLVSGCSMFNKEASHDCKANSCKAKKESHSCKANSCKANSCKAKKGSHSCKANSCEAKK